jgi:hypothetical protein
MMEDSMMQTADLCGAITIARQRILGTLAPILIAAFCALGPATLPLKAQDYMTEQYDRVPTDPATADLGYVEQADGTLHIEIPLGSFPQRASSRPFDVKVVYDSSGLWVNNGANYWMPGLGGWSSGGGVSNSQQGNCSVNQSWTDPSGSTHYFPIKICNGGSGDALATDSSGYHMYINEPPTDTSVYAPDGTRVFDAYNFYPKDSNGNEFSADSSGGLDDTTGRRAFGETFSGSTSILTVPTSQGTISTYTLTYTNIPVKTYFQQSGMNEYSGTMYNVLQSLALPDGTTYTFKYDCDSSTGNPACGSPAGQSGYYGGLESVTLPTGGQATYTYTVFTDARSNKDLWLNSRTSAGGTWTYTPSLVSLGSSICGSIFTKCQQVQVTKPNGDSVVTDFRIDWIDSSINGGAFPVLTKYYTGAVSSANLLETVTDTYDFSQSCPLVSCSGHAYIRKTQEQVTVPVPGGTSITKQVQYTYDTPQQGNITGVKEWSYRAGTSPTFPATPDRATYTTYLTTGTNNIDRPLTITTCNNSGSSSYCTGGGGIVAQRLITYDSAALQSRTGASNHDDTNFGVSNTARGNATEIQDWVSGSSYLTTSFVYDMTGNVVQKTDPRNNVTSYSYTDSFFNDSGANPPSDLMEFLYHGV